jgi:DNA-binding NarL/FixJ family response regulator
MSDVLLTDADQAALRAIVAAEPVPGTPLPSSATLEHLARLIPCDAIGVVLADAAGNVVDEVVSPRGYHAAEMNAVDSLALGFANGNRHVVEVWMDRRDGRFRGRDLAVLAMLAPALQRLVRERPRPDLPPSLTEQERRVLDLVAAGWSNPEIAGRMSVATSTVRKHLEHAYRKLGVTNRFAAAMVLDGRPSRPDPTDAELETRDMFA